MVIHSSRASNVTPIQPVTKTVEEPKKVKPKRERKRPETKITEPIVEVEKIENILSEDNDVLIEE